MMLLLLVPMAYAQEITPVEDDPTPVGASVSIRAVQPSWLVPDWMWDQCLIAGTNLETCQSALKVCSTAPPALGNAAATLDLCLKRSDEDGVKIAAQITELDRLQAANQRYKRQRNTAASITVSLVVGAVASTALILTAK